MQDVEAGELTLVLFSTSVVVDDATEKRISDCVKCCVLGSRGRHVWIVPPTQIMPKLGTDTGKAQLELFWCVQRMPVRDGKEPDEVSMHLMDCRVLGAVSVRMANASANNARVDRFLVIC